MNVVKHTKWLLPALVLLPAAALAQEQTATSSTYFSNALFNTLLATIIALLFLIAALGSVLKNVAGSDLMRKPNEKNNDPASNSGIKNIVLLCFMGLSFYASAETTSPVPADDWRIGGLDYFTFFTLISVISIELLVAGVLYATIKNLLSTLLPSKALAAERAKVRPLMDKINAAVDVEKEESILLDHDYDGIKELDNDLPPWWKYGFYLTIVVGVVYLINYHITGTSPLQAEEYKISIKKAEAEIAEYMKNSANNVDETTVKMLSGEADLAAGKELFIATCAACHGKGGEGGVGPNLTDDYWLHAGGLKDIFKTIKYGWPDKGMKAWKDDFSPMQIAQLTSYIKTLRGTNPPNPKDKQGDLYVEETPAVADSTVAQVDSLQAAMPADTLKRQ